MGGIQLIAALLTFGLSYFAFIFIYNKLYIKDLINKGFKVRSVSQGNLDFISTRIGIPLPELNPA